MVERICKQCGKIGVWLDEDGVCEDCGDLKTFSKNAFDDENSEIEEAGEE